jgi:hypothetical protein
MAGDRPGRMPVEETRERLKDGKVRAAIWMTRELKRRLMDRAYEEGRTMAEIVESALVMYLEAGGGKDKKPLDT